MSDNSNFGFGKFVPGFDFLQNLAQGASQSLGQMPNLSSWVAPTLDVGELEKRISELKAVNFWLDQNSKALAATIQALEVQKMTLATLKGMNFDMADMAEALKPKSAQGARAKSAPQPDANGLVDPLQWWGALTQQFQEIAANTMKSATPQAAQPATAPAGGAAKKAARKTPARKKRSGG
jgi:hypothetical protein